MLKSPLLTSNSLKTLLISAGVLALTACGGGGSPATPAVTSLPGAPTGQQTGNVVISGAVSFEDVGVERENFTLDLSDLTNRPARGIEIEAVNAAGGVIARTITDAQGRYTVTVPSNTNVRVQAVARLLQNAQNSGASWDIAVRDNTSGRSLYVLAGSLTSSGPNNSVRNLTAPSGSNGSTQFTAPRTSGPFAILDTLYDAVTLFQQSDPNISFPPAQVFWSVNNRRVGSEFDVDTGELASTAFTFINNVPTILVLGDTATDSDEFDQHVIAHEFGHYFQRTLSRDDSIGGSHSLTSRLDARVSFSEGWGNALSAMVTGDPIYVDSGFGANDGFAFSVERNDIGDIIFEQLGIPGEGWFNEAAVQSILYDIFDSESDGADTVSAGFGVLQSAFTNPVFTNSEAATSIYSFTEALRAGGAVPEAALDSLLESQSIFGRGVFALGETNDGGIPGSLPIFPQISEGTPLTICSIDDAGPFNRIGVRNLLSFSSPNARNYQLSMRRISGLTNRDPDFAVFSRGNFVTIGNGPDSDIEIINRNLPSGGLIIDAYDFMNLDRNDASIAGDACYEFSMKS